VLTEDPDSSSPDGRAEIRYILDSKGGDLTHAVCPAGEVAPTHELPELDEAYFVLGGSGEIWRRHQKWEGITALRPGRFVWMPRGTQFQYRASQGSSLVFLVVVLPSWRRELFHTVDAGPWAAGAGGVSSPGAKSDEVWLSGDLHQHPDATAPDNSEIRLLGGVDRGSLAHCTLHPRTCSLPIRHRTIHEIRYVVGGHGELWRSDPEGSECVDLLWPGVAVDIPAGSAFQFRATGYEALRMVLLTIPGWPGADEALPVTTGRWQPSSYPTSYNWSDTSSFKKQQTASAPGYPGS
jgi:mannose-6-phosphate isomerase-like protein (cupin superfamily)